MVVPLLHRATIIIERIVVKVFLYLSSVIAVLHHQNYFSQ